MPNPMLQIGRVRITPEVVAGDLRSLGAVEIDGVPLRNPGTRFLPWFDSYDGDVFARFRFVGVETRGGQTVLRTRAVSNPDFPFRERRDCSGDLCFRDKSWDAAPVEADFNVVFEPAGEEIDGVAFSGFKYWFEYAGDTPIHRIIDRQTWEVGGNLDDVTICLRNWLTPPRMRVGRETAYSTVGLDKWAGLLPGNLWGRWTLLPSFDMQYGSGGVTLGWFDRVSLIRTVIETSGGEDALRVQDMHAFEQGKTAATNPKTVAWSPRKLDDVDALNLWTRVHDRENERARKQAGMREEEPPQICFSQNQWIGFRFDKSYEEVIATAGEFGADMIFIDPVWEHGQALREEIEQFIPPDKQKGMTLAKYQHSNMCCTFDFEVSNLHGGEAELKKLVERAKARGLRVLSWMATHYHPHTMVQADTKLGHGGNSIFAARESGRHPDTGYAASCWTANLNTPVAEKIRAQVLSVCERTGLAGFLWDSYCNLGWWSVDYSKGDMRPQYDRMLQLYADLTNAGLYVMPEAIVTFSTHSCCGLHGGNVYADDLLGYSYNTNISMHYGSADANLGEAPADWADKILAGEAPFSLIFQAFSHKRISTFNFHSVPRDKWNADAAAKIKELFKTYKAVRDEMKKRTVLKDSLGVRYEGGASSRSVLWSFKDHPANGKAVDAATGQAVADGVLRAERVYWIEP